MTKAEFLEKVAGDERIGSKKAAADAVDAVLDAITDTLTAGGEVNFTGFGKFHVAERSARQGVNPTREHRIAAQSCRARIAPAMASSESPQVVAP